MRYYAVLQSISTPTAVAGVGIHRRFSLYLFTWYLKNRYAARSIKLGIQMFHDELWKPVYFGVERSRSLTKTMSAWICALLWVLAFSSRSCYYLELCRYRNHTLNTWV